MGCRNRMYRSARFDSPCMQRKYRESDAANAANTAAGRRQYPPCYSIDYGQQSSR